VSSHPYLFVYGTLKSSFQNPYAQRLQREARLLGRAQIPGRLYRISSYPGMRPPRDPKDLITGELYELHQPLQTLAVLDEWEEDYDRELHRAKLEKSGEDGQDFPAWVYVYRQSLPEDRYIASGEWR
jgi:gamma-glutamylcyclotransferase (GGCT)/AIG2-like uncharacterized protein YtfP